MDDQISRGVKEEYVPSEKKLNYTGLIPVFLLLVVVIARISYEIYKNNRQKTRNPQERRVYVGSRSRPTSYAQQEPTIFVSPSNLPPPPKYEAMAPPSYEEVVGIHYPNYPVQVQPITQPITTALGQTTANNVTNNVTNATNNEPSTVITVTANERRTSVTVATSS